MSLYARREGKVVCPPKVGKMLLSALGAQCTIFNNLKNKVRILLMRSGRKMSTLRLSDCDFVIHGETEHHRQKILRSGHKTLL